MTNIQQSWEYPYSSPRRTEIFGTLGPLELTILEVLCAKEEASSREVMEAIGAGYAYTSISTTLDRLVKKGIARRRRESRAFVYAANLTPEDLFRRRCLEMLRTLIATSAPDLVISQMVNSIAGYDPALLDELERKVQERRKELGLGGGRVP